jgi:beta-1,4-N-acetylglucosaminyltransferase
MLSNSELTHYELLPETLAMNRLLIVLGEGGHTAELLALVDLLGEGYEYCYLLAKGDKLSAPRIRRPGPIYRVPRAREKVHNLPRDVLRVLRNARLSWRALRAARPQAVISAGPGMAVPICLLARLAGVPLIYLETGSRVRRLSLSGRIVYPFAGLFFVQWPELQRRYPRAVYAGRLC